MTHSAWRRRSLVAFAGGSLLREADRISDERGLEREEAIAAVFADPALLAQVHQVGGVVVPDMPVSTVTAQNGPSRA